MRLPRFTTRRLMVLAALVAVLLGLAREAKRLAQVRRSHQLRVVEYTWKAKAYQPRATSTEKELKDAEARLSAFRAGRIPDDLGEPERSMLIRSSTEGPIAYRRWLSDKAEREEILLEGRQAEARRFGGYLRYYTALKVKYERAAARPWLPVPPDPPTPE